MKGVFARQKIYRFNTEMDKILITVFLAFSFFGIASVNADEHNARIDTFIDDLFDAHDEVFELYDEFKGTGKSRPYWLLDGWADKATELVSPLFEGYQLKRGPDKLIDGKLQIWARLRSVQNERATRHFKDFDA